MKKFPAIIHMTEPWLQSLNEVGMRTPAGTVPARPLPFYGLFGRWRAAWLVFTGKADALVWPAGQ